MSRTVVARAPGRVNLIGEHLDYNGGSCLPIALDRTTTASVAVGTGARRSDRATPGWTAYVDGVLAALGVEEPLDISISSDVPVGAGLSSSAALTCSVALAVDDLLGLGRTRDELCAATISAENDHVGVPTGGMDQTIALYAEPGTALLLDFATGTRTPVPFAPPDLSLLVIDTAVRHALVDGAYAARRADCEAAATHLRLTHLAHATAEQIDALPGGRLGRRARHVATEQQRVQGFVTALQVGDWKEAGALMTASHASLRDDYEVSCPELDLAVERALEAGALGARMTGGGFGGCAIALVPDGLLDAVRISVADGFAGANANAPTMFVVGASGGAEVLVG
ncbi:galactokinase [Nocardioides marmoriginsengisoli]|uniref:Galactokinase n=1 Tax=Nocardioides marmoriginsengisoli TaxID=661483 RepID=A0A3N0CR91_9ACTN|nr:galactokinase family protein [Nocardioides marmoriginsengisoli]RNL65791.1 galactokinase [Nocardioides marmoriginsengisoli]